MTRLPQREVVTVATNVPGPCQWLQIMGREVVSVEPVPPIAMQLRTGVAMLGYVDDLYFGILADYDAVPDVGELARDVEVAVARLVASSKRGPGGTRPSGPVAVGQRLMDEVTQGQPAVRVRKNYEVPTGDDRERHGVGGRGAEEFHRERWRHDEEVRSNRLEPVWIGAL